ncbi:MAG TPA: extradiol dioxygenase [Bacteroidota bacterium]|nr:extradiol dioxygenase [Bacteroidota bacterium]
MITGAHSIVYSLNPEADRKFFRDVLGLPHVDVGEGWLIFALPPAEVAFHPGEKNNLHELYLLCDNVEGFVREMGALNVACAPIQDRGWGLLTQLTLPGGGLLGVYEARHERPGAKPARRRARTTGRARSRGGASRKSKNR